MKKDERCWFTLAFLYMALYLAFDAYFVGTYDGNRSNTFFYLHQTLYVTLTLMYTVVIVMLNKEMRCLQGDFDKEIKSVNG